MGNPELPQDVLETIRDLAGERWKQEKRKFLRSLGDPNHPFRNLARLNDYFDFGFPTGKAAREMLENGPFDDRGEMETSFPEEAEAPVE